MALCTVATCNLNQWALDFDGNLARTEESIRVAKEKGARFRAGPELELSGYGCEDHFLEVDTYVHCWESLGKILSGDATDGILCKIGMPVMHKTVRYNCSVYCLDRKILLLRPKMFLAQDGNYRESRYFAPWQKGAMLEECILPDEIRHLTGQNVCPFGYAALDCLDTCVGEEACEELWTPNSPHIMLALDGVEIIANGSGSHHQLRKLQTRLDLIISATTKSGGVYLYANQQGCDGSRLYFDGSALIAANGTLLSQGSQFSPNDVEVVCATVDLEEVRSYRGSVMSRSNQASSLKEALPRVKASIQLCHGSMELSVKPTAGCPVYVEPPMEEIAKGPAMWMWDYLRRSGARGFFVALSGGADSGSVVTIVGSMCQTLLKHVDSGDFRVREQIASVLKCKPEEIPKTHKELANEILHTTYMGTVNSSTSTRKLAKDIASEIGAYHLDATIDPIVKALETVFTALTGKSPKFGSKGGSPPEDLALQNIQARSRMVLAYMLASLLPWVRGKNGWLLVVATGNVDEGLRGYLTKYDCSSGDLNPIGSISKVDLKCFLYWAADNLGYPSLRQIVEAPPTAELRPIEDSASGLHTQTDEADMGMSYEELGVFGRLRKISRHGPVSMFRSLAHEWAHLGAAEVARKVKHFFRMYAINRHKMTTITPAYHAENYSPDDNRFDHRQFLYPFNFPRQFAQIDRLVGLIEAKEAAKKIRSLSQTNAN
uniref:Glutamine-dependent NAD(+) synthetase n=1 Tax=Chromera velia CCMP2878 TaxID=1169474 RepID=A0A0G4IER3_9ALVE|eukprot:Cvel_13803.t1-p1 / transcript=Cvel_13803.t1 / gene=Cvel_13803 / organism=Chromera_velia_CCMP2878 / gene_product=Glutamine-dependent NAD( ) synthetase, putative / transcript_product=Glutamine-dependent NAD( ) synthetase, putative / location=Cvel_scaffold957:47634-55383(-) / protein_length=716 / sequence_SO=supercontig / SO=protein_coding / is_pseudo=false